jgi:hypothetical protein
VADKIDITGEFLLVFKKFGPTIIGEKQALHALRTEPKTSQTPLERVMGKSIRRLAADRRSDCLASDLLGFFDSLARALFDSYRPELHYMRGPGPRWHAKHDPAPADYERMPAFAPVRVEG